MTPSEHQAAIGPIVVTLLAIAAFFCIVTSPPADPGVGWRTARAEPQAGEAQSTGEPK